MDSFLAIAAEAKFNSLEKIKGLHIASEPFSIENGILTPTMKIMRHSAKLTFEKEIEEMYKE